MSQWGLDFSELAAQGVSAVPAMVEGRVLHIDGDFISYHSSLPDLDGNLRPLAECVEQFMVQCDTLRCLAGASTMHIHLTHPESTKGGRYEAAIQQPYQENRVKEYDDPEQEAFDRAAKELVHSIRFAVAKKYNKWTKYEATLAYCTISRDYEADDTMSWAMYADPHAVIWSGDKDLGMVPGKHLVDKEYYIRDVKGFGGCYLDESGSSVKVRGWGTSFLWHQLLMGDSADNIKGLASISTIDLNEFFKTKDSIGYEERVAALAAYERALQDDPEGPIATGKAPRKPTKAQTEAHNRAPQPCGPTKAYALLEDCKTDRQCLQRVKRLYENTYGSDWQRIFLSEGHMLWMTRYPGDTFQTWLGELLNV